MQTGGGVIRLRATILALAAVVGCGGAPASSTPGAQAPTPVQVPSAVPGQPTQRVDSLPVILSDTRIWGADFPSGLAYLRSWQRAGEREVAVFSNMIMGTTPHTDSAPAILRRDSVSAEIRAAQPRLRPAFAGVAAAQRAAFPFRITTIRF